MPRWSKRIELPGGGTAIVCGRSPYRRCSTPGCRANATIQCDYPVERRGKAGTCDRWTCRQHATNVGPDRDYCLPHARAVTDPDPEPEVA